MSSLFRLLAAEFLKLRRSSALRIAWLLPLLYLLITLLIVERPAIGLGQLSPQLVSLIDLGQVRMLGALWAGFFHPVLLAMIPALVFRPEHRFKTWTRLHAMPVSRRSIFLVKAALCALLLWGALLLVVLGHFAMRSLAARLNPLLDFPFHALEMIKVIIWLWFGSLPLLALYLWTSDRINSLAVPIVFGVIGLMLTISLSGAEVPQAWKRDLIPWVLPYCSAQQAIQAPGARQGFHSAGSPFQLEEKNSDVEVFKLPSGRKVTVRNSVPWAVIFPPPKPTPKLALILFSLGAGAIILSLATIDANRDRY